MSLRRKPHADRTKGLNPKCFCSSKIWSVFLRNLMRKKDHAARSTPPSTIFVPFNSTPCSLHPMRLILSSTFVHLGDHVWLPCFPDEYPSLCSSTLLSSNKSSVWNRTGRRCWLQQLPHQGVGRGIQQTSRYVEKGRRCPQ